METGIGAATSVRQKVANLYHFDTAQSAVGNHNLPLDAASLAQHQSSQSVRKQIGRWQSHCDKPYW
jgi:hypothetical protein